MKLATLILAALATLATFADGPYALDENLFVSTSDFPIVTLNVDGSANSWSQADLVSALQLMNRKYHRDVETLSGRTAWHGKLVMQTIDTNRLVKIERFADGTEFEFPFTPPTVKTPTPTQFSSSKVPARLAEARARRQAERETTNTVTVVVTPDTNTND